MAVLTALLRAFGLKNSDPEPFHGPEEIALARQELTMDEQPSEAMIGLARLKDHGGEFSTEPKAVIPLSIHDPFEDPAPLTFDVDGDELDQFCTAFGVEVHDLGVLEGATLPIRWEQGTPVPDWRALLEADQEGDDGE